MSYGQNDFDNTTSGNTQRFGGSDNLTGDQLGSGQQRSGLGSQGDQFSGSNRDQFSSGANSDNLGRTDDFGSSNTDKFGSGQSQGIRSGSDQYSSSTGGTGFDSGNQYGSSTTGRTDDFGTRDQFGSSGTGTGTGAGRDDFDTSATGGNQFGSSTAGGDKYSSGMGSQTKPGIGDKIKGGAEKVAGKMSKNPELAQRGAERQTGNLGENY